MNSLFIKCTSVVFVWVQLPPPKSRNYLFYVPLTNQSVNFDTKTAFRFGGLFLRLCPETVYSCGPWAFSVSPVGGVAAPKFLLRHGRPPEIHKRFRICPLYIDKIKIGESLKSIPAAILFNDSFLLPEGVRQLNSFMPQGFVFCLPKSYSTMKFGEYMYYHCFGRLRV